MTLSVALLASQAARALDDLGEMFVRRMQHIHNAAKLALDRYRVATVERTDNLVTTLHELLLAHDTQGSVQERFSAMDAVIAPRTDELLEACEAHLAHRWQQLLPVRLARVQKPPRHLVRPARCDPIAVDESGHQCGGGIAFSSDERRPNRRVATNDAHCARGWRGAPEDSAAGPELGA